MIDRGFIKWQPFNSVISNKVMLDKLTQEQKLEKPTLSEEQISILNERIIEAYYAKNKVKINFYEQNKIKTIETTIQKINPTTNIIELNNHKKITFNQIINIK